MPGLVYSVTSLFSCMKKVLCLEQVSCLGCGAGLGIRECASSTSAQRLCVNPGNRGTVLTELAFGPLHCGLTFSREPAFPRNLPSPPKWHQGAAQVRVAGPRCFGRRRRVRGVADRQRLFSVWGVARPRRSAVSSPWHWSFDLQIWGWGGVSGLKVSGLGGSIPC